MFKGQFASLVYDVLYDGNKVDDVADTFFEAIPDIYQKLIKDAYAVLNFDPAAKSLEEVLVAYPGFYATAIYRLSHQLYQQNIKILPRLFKSQRTPSAVSRRRPDRSAETRDLATVSGPRSGRRSAGRAGDSETRKG